MNDLKNSPTRIALLEHGRALAGRSLASLFASEPERFSRHSLAWDDLVADWSKQRLLGQTLDLLVRHAEACNLPEWIAGLFAGEKINLSELRPALHTALRQQSDAAVSVDGTDVLPSIRATQARMQALAEQIRDGRRIGSRGQPIRYVVNIGIGGSDLGPLLVCDALGNPHGDAIEVAFVSNVDPEALQRALMPRNPATTLFIVTSKTFTTTETLRNATSARNWLVRALGSEARLAPHFIGVSANVEAARSFGIDVDDILPMWDWVGGRYSLWSAVGLPIAIQCGWDRFAELLAGAASMDEHFRTAPLMRNMPVRFALADWWNAQALGLAQRVVVPYSHALARLPAYLQQLVLESNGKSVTRDGAPLDTPTSPSLWGEPGTNGQHAFFQWLHQGTHPVPVEFVVPVRAVRPLADHQAILVGNALAQAQALMLGKSEEAVRAELVARGMSEDAARRAAPHRVSPGDRPSTMLLMPELSAYRLGQLLALHEHRTFVEGVLMGINSFDQWGVELGKVLAAPLVDAIRGGARSADLDGSTAGLLDAVQALARS